MILMRRTLNHLGMAWLVTENGSKMIQLSTTRSSRRRSRKIGKHFMHEMSPSMWKRFMMNGFKISRKDLWALSSMKTSSSPTQTPKSTRPWKVDIGIPSLTSRVYTRRPSKRRNKSRRTWLWKPQKSGLIIFLNHKRNQRLWRLYLRMLWSHKLVLSFKKWMKSLSTILISHFSKVHRNQIRKLSQLSQTTCSAGLRRIW